MIYTELLHKCTLGDFVQYNINRRAAFDVRDLAS